MARHVREGSEVKCARSEWLLPPSSVGLTLAVVASRSGWTMLHARTPACNTFLPAAITA